MKKIIFSNEDLDNIKNLYFQKISLKQIAESFNCSRGVISRVIKELDLPIRLPVKKYNCDDFIFQSITTEEQAYWLGFIAADGCVYEYPDQKRGSLIITLNKKDINQLEKFKIFMKTEAKIVFVDGEGYSKGKDQLCRITINSIQIIRDLINLGILPRKSLILKPPKNIPSNLLLHFIRGYFDGDGTIYNQNTNVVVGFCGTKEILEWIQTILNTDLSYSKRYDDNKNNYSIRVGGTNKPFKMISQFYDNSTIYLDRKHAQYLKLKERVVHSSNIMEY